MSSARPVSQSSLPLVQLIQADCQREPGLHARLVEETHGAVHNNQVNRVFDCCPRMLNDLSLTTYGLRYLEILRDATFTLDNMPDVHTANKIKQFSYDLIQLGIADIFPDNQLNAYLVDMLCWADVIDKLDKQQLLCSYFGAVMPQMTHHFHESINKHLAEQNANISHYLNGKYSMWVKEVMMIKGLLPTNSPSRKSLLLAGAGVLFGVASAVVAGAYALNSSTSSDNDDSLFKINVEEENLDNLNVGKSPS